MADFTIWTFTPSGWTPEYSFTPTSSLAPQWIIGEDGIDWSNYPKITLHCLAFGNYNDANMKNARDYTGQFFSMSSEQITNEALYKGGTDLQTSPPNRLILIIEGDGTSSGYNEGYGAILSPKFTEKQYSKRNGKYYIRKLGIYTDSVIEFDLEIELQLPCDIHP